MRALRDEYKIARNEYNRDWMRKKREGTWERKIAEKGKKEEKTAVACHLTQDELMILIKLSNDTGLSRSKILANCFNEYVKVQKLNGNSN